MPKYCRSYLAFVGPIVPFLNIFDLKSPIVRTLGMQHLKPLVVRVGEHGAGQDVEITPSYPGYLKQGCARQSSISLPASGCSQPTIDKLLFLPFPLTSASDTVLSARLRTLQCKKAVPPNCTVTLDTVLLSFASFTLCRSSRLLNQSVFQLDGM